MRWALFLDFDGTLVELAPSPDKISVPPELPRLLMGLSQRFAGALAIFTGRALADLDHHLGVRFPACGQHGAQRRVEAEGEVWQADMPPLDRVRDGLRALTETWPKLLVEDKGTTLAVHFRAVPEAGGSVRAVLDKFVDQSKSTMEIQEGKYVYELRPAGVDKGIALEEFMSVPPFAGCLPLAVGDDVTDEAAFESALRAGGSAIKVGAGATHAPWHLDNPHSVCAWLGNLQEAGR